MLNQWVNINQTSYVVVAVAVLQLKVPNIWLSAPTNVLNHIGIGLNFNGQIHQKAFKRLCDIFYQGAFLDIIRVDSKLRTFAKVKHTVGIEKYLLHPMDLEVRTAITKFRLSNHELMIEKGRHQKLDKSIRFCPFCPISVETELHFLLICETFSCLRADLFTEIAPMLPPLFNLLTDDDKFTFLLCTLEVIKYVGIFLEKGFNIRKFLIERHKNAE